MGVEQTEPTNREIIDHMHTLHRAALQCQLEGVKLILNRLLAVERQLERVEQSATTNGAKP